MSTPQTDTLSKPDMKAVLSRTHLNTDTHGFLLPVLEAISNAMDGIESRFGGEAENKGLIKIRFENLNDPTKIMISVTDNGIGLTDDNYNSFRTPFSGYKLKQRGRGFGRFIAFKVFNRILYSSRHEFFKEQIVRTFRFNINEKNEFNFHDGEPDFSECGLCVEYNQPLRDWYELIKSLKENSILEEIGSHFLPFFLYKWLPTISIQFDDATPEDIKAHFQDIFVEYENGDFSVKIEGRQEKVNYSLTRIPKSPKFTNHCLLFSAADRIVGHPRDLTNKIGQPHFTDEKDQKYIVIAVLRSDAFEERLNDSRTSINIPLSSIEEIIGETSNIIQRKESDQIDKIKEYQSHDLDDALKENPILRLGLRGKTISEYVSNKPNNWKPENFISDLAIQRYRATNELTKQIAEAAKNPNNYGKNIQDLVSKLDAGQKEALAEYVLHRKSIIELVEQARRHTDQGKHAPEDTIHDLVFRRFRDNVETGYFQHNLWLIDDMLAFLPYVSSDRSMHGKGRKKGDKVSDLMFYDDSMILGDNEGTTLGIIEFKRPSRDDYKFGNAKTDPVLQVLDTLDQATKAGGIAKTDGTHMSFGNMPRRYAFIIADLTPTLIEVLKKHDFKNDMNPKIFIRYRDNEKLFIQAYGYETLVEMAKKRNQAFFTVLLGE